MEADEPGLVVVGVAQTNRTRAHESVPTRRVARAHAENGARDHAFAVHHDEPVHGADELRLAFAPAHDLGNWEYLQRGFDSPREHFVKLCAFRGVTRDINFPLRGWHALERIDCEAILLCKTFSRFCASCN